MNQKDDALDSIFRLPSYAPLVRMRNVSMAGAINFPHSETFTCDSAHHSAHAPALAQQLPSTPWSIHSPNNLGPKYITTTPKVI